MLRYLICAYDYFTVSSLLSRQGILFSSIGVAPVTLVTHVRNKNINIQGRSINVISHKGKNSLPLGAIFSL